VPAGDLACLGVNALRDEPELLDQDAGLHQLADVFGGGVLGDPGVLGDASQGDRVEPIVARITGGLPIRERVGDRDRGNAFLAQSLVADDGAGSALDFGEHVGPFFGDLGAVFGGTQASPELGVLTL
jgi:hypothetical protein